MGNPRLISVDVTTAADGSATAYSNEVLRGQVVNVIYTKDGTNPFSNGVDFAITGESSGVSLWTDTDVNASEKVSPVQAGNINTSGAASTLTENPVFLTGERIKIIIAQGGDTKFGNFKFTIV